MKLDEHAEQREANQPATSEPFGRRLAEAVRRRGTPVVVGLDPRRESLPGELRAAALSGDLATAARAYLQFCQGVIDVVAPLVPAVKPQSAFFEQLGPAGVATLAEVIRYARSRGLLVLIDAKRGDIGSTAEAYADAYLGPSESRPLAGDAMTVNPYLGPDTIEPFIKAATDRRAGIFVLVKTSNPGSGQLQDLASSGEPIYRHVARQVETWADSTRDGAAYGAVGAVVGATYRQQLVELREVMPHAWLLVPGYGSQGGTATDTAPAFDERGLGAIINNARGIIFAHSRKPYAERFNAASWQQAVEAATRDMIAELRAETRAGKLPPRGARS